MSYHIYLRDSSLSNRDPISKYKNPPHPLICCGEMDGAQLVRCYGSPTLNIPLTPEAGTQGLPGSMSFTLRKYQPGRNCQSPILASTSYR